MSIQTNKQLVAGFLGRFARSDIGGVLAMMTDDATWWVNGKSRLYPGSGSKTKPEMERVWHDLYGMLDGGLRMDVTGMIAEGDQVAAEVRSHATTRAGQVYDNDYHMLFAIRDGKIALVREYTDLMHAAEVFG